MDEFQWYAQLHQYSRPNEDEDEDIRPEDDLPVQMCSTVFIPRLNALIVGGGFDPYSAAQIPRLVDIAEQVEAYLGRDSPKYLVSCPPQSNS